MTSIGHYELTTLGADELERRATPLSVSYAVETEEPIEPVPDSSGSDDPIGVCGGGCFGPEKDGGLHPRGDPSEKLFRR